MRKYNNYNIEIIPIQSHTYSVRIHILKIQKLSTFRSYTHIHTHHAITENINLEYDALET